MKLIIWDFSGTLYNTKNNSFCQGAEELLEKCSSRYKQVLVTAKLNDPKGRIELIKQLGIWKYFEEVKISLKTKDLFQDICRKLECKEEEVFVIGDGYRFGPYPKEIMTGNKLGMKTIWIDLKNTPKWKEKILGIKYWKKVKSLQEIDKIIF